MQFGRGALNTIEAGYETNNGKELAACWKVASRWRHSSAARPPLT